VPCFLKSFSGDLALVGEIIICLDVQVWGFPFVAHPFLPAIPYA